jgi:hypothetical protein
MDSGYPEVFALSQMFQRTFFVFVVETDSLIRIGDFSTSHSLTFSDAGLFGLLTPPKVSRLIRRRKVGEIVSFPSVDCAQVLKVFKDSL